MLGSWLWPCSTLNGRKEGKTGHWHVSRVEKPQAARGPFPIFCLSFPIYFVFICLIFSASSLGLSLDQVQQGILELFHRFHKGRGQFCSFCTHFTAGREQKAVTYPEVRLWGSSRRVRVKCERENQTKTEEWEEMWSRSSFPAASVQIPPFVPTLSWRNLDQGADALVPLPSISALILIIKLICCITEQ